MKIITLLTSTLLACTMVLTACAQTSVSVRPVKDDDKASVRQTAVNKKAIVYTSISRDEDYIAQAGDTLYGISLRAGLNYRDVAAWNNIAEPYTVKIGQRILLRPAEGSIPPDTSIAATKPSDVKPAEKKPADVKPIEVKPVENKPPVAITKPVVTTAPAVEPSNPVVSSPATTAPEKPPVESKPVETNAMLWRWPTEGSLIARFVAGDPTQQGINIAGKSGQPVRASIDGTVVYSGAGLVGYGELIIIKHNNEWLSAYAHNRKRLVAEGTKVKTGDVIAEMGRTGTIRDMLHFEIRRNGKPVDPLQYLPKR